MVGKRTSWAPLLFLFDSLLCQAIGVGCLIAAWGVTESLPFSLFVGSCAAAGSAMTLELTFPWKVLNFILIPAAALSLSAATIPPELFLALLILFAVIHGPALWTRVPYYPTSNATYAVILAELPAQQSFTFLDIGCGFGDLLLFLSKQRPMGRFEGIEISLLPFVSAWTRMKLRGRKNVRIRYCSMWAAQLEKFDWVYSFLSPAPMKRLWEKVRSEMRGDTIFITNTFEVPSTPAQTIRIKDERESVLYFHRISQEESPLNEPTDAPQRRRRKAQQ